MQPFEAINITNGLVQTKYMSVELKKIYYYTTRNCEFEFEVRVNNEIRIDKTTEKETFYIGNCIRKKEQELGKVLSRKQAHKFISETYYQMII